MGREIYRRYFAGEKPVLLFIISMIAVGTAIGGIQPYLYGRIIDSITGADARSFRQGLLWLLVIMALTQALEAAESVLGNWLVNRVENRIKADLMGRILHLQCGRLDEFEEGELLNRLEFDAETIVDYYLDVITSILMIAFNLCVSVWFILHISRKLSLITFAALPLLYAVNFLFRGKIYRANDRIRRFDDRYYSLIHDILGNLKPVKAAGEEESLSARYTAYLKTKMQLLLKSIYIAKLAEIIRGVFGNVLNVIILFVSGLAIIGGQMTIGNMVAFNSYLEKFFEAVSSLLKLNLNRQGILVSYERIRKLEQLPAEDVDAGIAVSGRITEIAFAGVSFGYAETPVVEEVNFRMEGNGLYSIVGENGCGKTTILKLLERFYPCDSGRISVNGRNLQEYSLRSLRGQIAYMAKEPFFLQCSVRENMRLGNPAVSDQEIIDACKKTGIHEDILQMPEGYETRLEKNAGNLSSGQKQKLGLARVLLSGASLILLDEATSDLDGSAEQEICSLISELAERAIVLNVAHKEESVRRSRRVCYLEEGRIAGEGTHEELLEKNAGYRRLFPQEMFN